MEFELIDDITGEEEIEEPTQDDEEFESRWFHGGDFPNLHFTDESCYIWVVLDNGGEDLDLYSLGNGPASTDHWLYDELSYNGWSCIISPEHKTIDSGEGWVFVQSWTNWAMRQGVAPGQPFLLQLDKPNPTQGLPLQESPIYLQVWLCLYPSLDTEFLQHRVLLIFGSLTSSK